MLLKNNNNNNNKVCNKYNKTTLRKRSVSTTTVQHCFFHSQSCEYSSVKYYLKIELNKKNKINYYF